MTLPTDLLDQADHLLKREPKRPKQASLRRSISTAYYALFHLLTSECALVITPYTEGITRNYLQRVLNHREMKRACGRFLQTPLTKSLAVLVGSHANEDLKAVALAFTQLQEARHSADYDLNSEWTRAMVAANLQTARDAFATWKRIRKTSEANFFLLSFLILDQLDATR